MINNVKDAIELLKEKRDFEVEDMSKFKWKVSDEDFSELLKTDEELIFFANEQSREVENDTSN